MASILEVINLFIPGFVDVGHSYGSHNLVGPVADAVLPFVMPIMAGALGMFLLAMLYLMYKGRGNNGVWAAVPLCMLVLAFIFVGLNKVYSAQYHLWMITIFFVLLAVPLSRQELRISMALVVGMCVFATINSFTYSSILDPSFVVVIFIRNIFHL